MGVFWELSRTFVAPKNAQNAETKRQSGAVPIPLLALSASTTSAYSSLGVLWESDPDLSYLRRRSTTQPHQLYLILVTETMKEFGIVLEFKATMITIDEIILPRMRNINNLQGASILRALKLNHSLAMEPQSTQDATNHSMQILDAK